MQSDSIATKRSIIRSNGSTVPCVLMSPGDSIGSVVGEHGYWNVKKNSPAWRIAEAGICACAIDLRGHGEHMIALDELRESAPDRQDRGGTALGYLYTRQNVRRRVR